jgi:antibiotic biosynthesis monooxygenase (ABM) superfamily enzyme
MIKRVWHGWTTPDKADPYENLLRDEIFTGIADRSIPGYGGIKLLRRDVPPYVEFMTIMTFNDLDAVKAFAGEDYEVSVVPPKARALLDHFDEKAQHYDVRAEMFL